MAESQRLDLESQPPPLDAMPATQLEPEPPADEVESAKKRQKEEPMLQPESDRMNRVGDLCFVQKDLHGPWTHLRWP